MTHSFWLESRQPRMKREGVCIVVTSFEIIFSEKLTVRT